MVTSKLTLMFKELSHFHHVVQTKKSRRENLEKTEMDQEEEEAMMTKMEMIGEEVVEADMEIEETVIEITVEDQEETEVMIEVEMVATVVVVAAGEEVVPDGTSTETTVDLTLMPITENPKTTPHHLVVQITEDLHHTLKTSLPHSMIVVQHLRDTTTLEKKRCKTMSQSFLHLQMDP